MNDFNQAQYSNQVEQLEDCDLFNSGGGIELDIDPIENVTVGLSRAYIGDGTYIGDGYKENANFHHSFPNGVSTIIGEHPYGEHPSRTLFVRSIDSNVDDSELRSLFEIRETPNKRHHKFIEYYDVRAAENALRSLNNCDIAGSIIKLEPSRPGGVRRNLSSVRRGPQNRLTVGNSCQCKRVLTFCSAVLVAIAHYTVPCRMKQPTG
ncbi:hypothetical protein HPP92_007852 [Vanilla planifolia]|uniref:RRM domain-containing protein n=1 Tax=Vanilla planifolia TaxID=51239 RepID=A0A835V835_VANPL|nr:hypothetical protein HPP92_007852 [Vanilla planifolia]